jgi:hypothetical protein
VVGDPHHAWSIRACAGPAHRLAQADRDLPSAGGGEWRSSMTCGGCPALELAACDPPARVDAARASRRLCGSGGRSSRGADRPDPGLQVSVRWGTLKHAGAAGVMIPPGGREILLACSSITRDTFIQLRDLEHRQRLLDGASRSRGRLPDQASIRENLGCRHGTGHPGQPRRLPAASTTTPSSSLAGCGAGARPRRTRASAPVSPRSVAGERTRFSTPEPLGSSIPTRILLARPADGPCRGSASTMIPSRVPAGLHPDPVRSPGRDRGLDEVMFSYTEIDPAGSPPMGCASLRDRHRQPHRRQLA